MKSIGNYLVQPGRYISNLGYKIKSKLWYPLFFGKFGKGSLLIHPLKIDNPKGILIGKNCCINFGGWLNTGGDGKITVGDGTQIGHHVHMSAWYEGIDVGENVLFADKVFVSDCKHMFENADVPVVKQPIESLSKVIIGSDSWIGENVVINGCKVGKHCVIGANSFVNKDIPDYCVAVGQPARVVKTYDFDKKEWVSVK